MMNNQAEYTTHMVDSAALRVAVHHSSRASFGPLSHTMAAYAALTVAEQYSDG